MCQPSRMKPLAEGRCSKQRRDENPVSEVVQLTDERENATVESYWDAEVDDQPQPQPGVDLERVNSITKPKATSEVIFEPLPHAAIVFGHGPQYHTDYPVRRGNY